MPSDTSTPTTATTEPLHFITEDDCCAKALSRDLHRGRLAANAETWTHAKCGCEWRSRLKDGIVFWYPVVFFEVLR